MKIYLVQFMEYTNGLKDTVCKCVNKEKQKYEYKEVSKDGCLVKENQLGYFKQFGGGFRNITLMGILAEGSNDSEKE